MFISISKAKQGLMALCVLAGAIALTSCASIVTGTKQSIAVNTDPAVGATCSLENDKGKWIVNSTPATVKINRSFNDLQINCEKRGYHPIYKQIASKTKGMAFGNAVFGGLIGAGIDMADGAAYDYPTDIYVPMKRLYA